MFTEPQQPPIAKQSELEFNASELAQPELGESVEVWFNSEWVEAILLQAPNNHPDPAQRLTGWKVRISGTKLERYFWQGSEIRASGGGT